jgi:hypothetical protein
MIEVIINNYLNDHLDVPSFLEKPDNVPERYVLLDKTGGGKSNYLPSSVFAFQSYAESKYQASKLNEEVKDVVEQMIELDEMRGINLNSDYNFTDTTTKEYRYQAVFDINHY